MAFCSGFSTLWMGVQQVFDSLRLWEDACHIIWMCRSLMSTEVTRYS